MDVVHLSRRPSVVVVMPAFNEEGLPGFIAEIAEHLNEDVVSSLKFVVVDDASEPPLRTLHPRGLGCDVEVLTNEQNLGHGPTVRRAYAAGLSRDADVIVHVDGDGQFHGRDFPALLQALESADIVHGQRRGRVDPWYRAAISSTLRWALMPLLDGRHDVNTPLRAFRPHALAALLPHVDERATVPHVQLSLLAQASGLRMALVDVESRVRRGQAEVGTMWRSRRWTRWVPPTGLVKFCWTAAGEVVCAGSRTVTVVRVNPPLPTEALPALEAA